MEAEVDENPRVNTLQRNPLSVLSVVITHILGAPSAAGSTEHLCCLGTCQKCGVYIPVWLQNQNLNFDKVLRELMCTLEWRRKAPSGPWALGLVLYTQRMTPASLVTLSTRSLLHTFMYVCETACMYGYHVSVVA